MSASGNITANACNLGWGGITGALTTDGGNLDVRASVDITGVLRLGGGGTLSAEATYGWINAIVSSGGDIGTLTAAKSISGTITATGNIGTITAGLIPGISAVQGVSLSGTITAGGTIGTLTATAGINATATAYGSILKINAGTGDLAGSLTAQHGSLQEINATHGSITAILTGASIGTVTALQNISGTILATGSIASITSTLGTISSTITSVTGTIGGIAAFGNLAGNILANGGGIGSVFVGGNLVGNLSAQTYIGNVFVCGTMCGSLFTQTGSMGGVIVLGNITNTAGISAGGGDVAVEAWGSDAASISAWGNVTLVAGGTVSGNINSTAGAVLVSAGGSIVNSKTSALGNILLRAGGDISTDATSYQGGVEEDALGTITSDVQAKTVADLEALAIKASNVFAAISNAGASTINGSQFTGNIVAEVGGNSINGSTVDGKPVVAVQNNSYGSQTLNQMVNDYSHHLDLSHAPAEPAKEDWAFDYGSPDQQAYAIISWRMSVRGSSGGRIFAGGDGSVADLLAQVAACSSYLSTLQRLRTDLSAALQKQPELATDSSFEHHVSDVNKWILDFQRELAKLEKEIPLAQAAWNHSHSQEYYQQEERLYREAQALALAPTMSAIGPATVERDRRFTENAESNRMFWVVNGPAFQMNAWAAGASFSLSSGIGPGPIPYSGRELYMDGVSSANPIRSAAEGELGPPSYQNNWNDLPPGTKLSDGMVVPYIVELPPIEPPLPPPPGGGGSGGGGGRFSDGQWVDPKGPPGWWNWN